MHHPTTQARRSCWPLWRARQAGASRWQAQLVSIATGAGSSPDQVRVTRGRRCETDWAAGDFEPPCPYCGQRLATALVSEKAPLDPRNAYASSKVAQEFYASNWAWVTGGSVAKLRYHNVYGP